MIIERHMRKMRASAASTVSEMPRECVAIYKLVCAHNKRVRAEDAERYAKFTRQGRQLLAKHKAQRKAA